MPATPSSTDAPLSGRHRHHPGRAVRHPLISADLVEADPGRPRDDLRLMVLRCHHDDLLLRAEDRARLLGEAAVRGHVDRADEERVTGQHAVGNRVVGVLVKPCVAASVRYSETSRLKMTSVQRRGGVRGGR
ncbi:hypothetical protein [Streptomyces justiciae]|uniref:hypothetical protein n=1 Tax=Streptomyces justiciae TaxID=2780140 RepID=UPI0036F1D4E3